ncbi:MAG: TIM barrel protein [Paludisphaera borealis]|uniref:sugar phosphate isomerase/epimerase family protein n=1 Tax=Paludisphaera borealis TaxID=1387353 RepID=UPI00284704D1|nr:TIM barrel protein [Paludisphaera borealis]MDR3618881.1 TIM barrel protein [Paludisphaera borealis]
MIRNPLGLRLDPNRAIREQIQQAARLGARGVVLEASGDLAPHRLGETGRRELKHLLRSVELSLIAIHLPTRRTFDTTDQLDERVRRVDAAFAMTFDLGARIVLAQIGAAPDAEAEPARREVYTSAVASLARRAEHRGVRLAIENGAEPGQRTRAFLDALNDPSLAASVDPPSLLRAGIDPVTAARELGPWLAHAYAGDAVDAPNAPRNPRGVGFHPGSLDWEEYIGALEEVAYHGFLTVWPEPTADPARQFKAVVERISEIG